MNNDIPQYEQDLQKLKEAQQTAAVASLEREQQSALSSLEAEKSTVQPTYQSARRSASADSALGAKNFAEYLANRGLSNSGVAAEADIRRTGALQRDLGALRTEEASQLGDIARRESLAQQDYATGLRQAESEIESNYIANSIEQGNIQREWDFAQQQYKDSIEQRDWERAFELQQYQDALKQQAFENSVLNRNYYSANSGDEFTFAGYDIEVDGTDYPAHKDTNGNLYYLKGGNYYPISADGGAGTTNAASNASNNSGFVNFMQTNPTAQTLNPLGTYLSLADKTKQQDAQAAQIQSATNARSILNYANTLGR